MCILSVCLSFSKPPRWVSGCNILHTPADSHPSHWLTCDIPLPLIGALLVRVGRRHALRWVLSLQTPGHGAWQPVSTYTVQLRPSTSTAAHYYRGDDGRAGLGRPQPRLAGVELPVGSLVAPLALLVRSVVAGVGGVRRGRHQAGAGEVCVGQELGLLVEGERGLLVLQVGSRHPWVRVPHAAPDRAAGVGAPHTAAGWLIHNAGTLHTILPSVLLRVCRGVETSTSRKAVRVWMCVLRKIH